MRIQLGRVPIPPTFQSVEKGGPFLRCLDCDRDLTAPETRYFVEKCLRGSETIYEFALCFGCREQLESRISRRSMRRIEAYYDAHLVAPPGAAQVYEDILAFKRRPTADALRPWIGRCVVDGAAIDESEERVIVGICEAGELLLGSLPMAISYRRMEEIQELLSPETREELDGWRKEHLGTPPELEELLRGPRVVVF